MGEGRFESFSQNGKRFALTASDSSGYVWDLPDAPGTDALRPTSLHATTGPAAMPVKNAEFAEDGRLVVTNSDGSACYYGPAMDKEPMKIKLAPAKATDDFATLATDQRGLWIVTALRVIPNSATMKPVVQGHPPSTPSNASPSPIPTSPTSTAASLRPDLAYVWNLTKAPNDPQPVASLKGFPLNLGLPYIVVDPKGRRLLAVSAQVQPGQRGQLLVWDLQPPSQVRPDAESSRSSPGEGVPFMELLGSGNAGQVMPLNVRSVAISSDARWVIATVSTNFGWYDSEPYLWDLEALNPTQPVRLRGHEKPLSAAVLAPDDQRLVTASQDSTARVWDLDSLSISAQPVRISPSAAADLPSPAALISDNRRWLAAIHLDGAARLYGLNADDPTIRPTPVTPKGHHTRWLTTSVDRRWLGLVGDHDLTLLNLEDARPDAQPVVLTGMPKVTLDLRLATDEQGRWFATDEPLDVGHTSISLPMQRRIRLWNRPTKTGPVRPITLKNAIVSRVPNVYRSRSIVVDPTGRRMAVLRNENKLELWTLADPDPSASAVELMETSEGAAGRPIQGFSSTPDGARIVVGKFTPKADRNGQTFEIHCLNLGADDPNVTARTVNVGVNSVPHLPYKPFVLAFTSDRRWLIDCRQEGARLLSLEPSETDRNRTCETLTLVDLKESERKGASFSPDPTGHWLLAAYSDDRFDLRMMPSLNDLSGVPTKGNHLIIVASVNESLNCRIFDFDGVMAERIYDTTLTKDPALIDLIKQLKSLSPPHKLTTNEKDQVIAAVRSVVGLVPDRNVSLFDLTRCDPQKPTKPIQVSLSRDKSRDGTPGVFSNDGRWLAIGFGESASLWQLDNETPHKELSVTGLNSRINGLAVSPNDNLFAIASGDGLIRCFDRNGDARGGVLYPAAEFPGLGFVSSDQIAISRDGKHLFTTEFNAATISARSLDQLLEITRRAVGRNMTREEWDQFRPKGGNDESIPKLIPELGDDTGRTK